MVMHNFLIDQDPGRAVLVFKPKVSFPHQSRRYQIRPSVAVHIIGILTAIIDKFPVRSRFPQGTLDELRALVPVSAGGNIQDSVVVDVENSRTFGKGTIPVWGWTIDLLR